MVLYNKQGVINFGMKNGILMKIIMAGLFKFWLHYDCYYIVILVYELIIRIHSALDEYYKKTVNIVIL